MPLVVETYSQCGVSLQSFYDEYFIAFESLSF